MPGGKGGKGGKGPGGGGAGGGLSGSTMGLIALFGGLVLVLGGIAVADQLGWVGGSGAGQCDTLEGSQIHEHAELFVYLDGDGQPYDFSAERYQVAAGFVHFEAGQQDANGATIHIHERRPTLGCLFSTIDWQVSQDRIVTDTGETYAEDANNELKILVNGKPAEDGFRTVLVGERTYEVRFTHPGGTDGGNETGNNTTQAWGLGLLPGPVAADRR